ncbi:hypothetical protein LX15_003598 [Streptoalloteichus tenebrarius]|uniref:Secreted protein n=1 Tax=Streptoalloteichus tenebrarius (strain ATCC 17920 / DSM 40477 / JCM 4838 / CBS 697.72 / NBRC 16177 / NCIMB 11028 / NRRL B-12390 / A12253. 1 / ISP 5477) TaxID=1933 RepID=A0ABT1HWL3_STRSD|nr:hypothetical protein [Streptoalloteichus tenebrarius]MCP2259889.1 hypothetical protein [Streptoalloteichus tenebrarius]BFF03213.1 hypothetical protein GCM10020241_48880 [Streptoalloteichus tenebrarius]
MVRTIVAALGAALSLSLVPASAVADPAVDPGTRAAAAPAATSADPVALVGARSVVEVSTGDARVSRGSRREARRDLMAARAASARFRDLKVALDEGYVPMGQSCVSSPEGGMGRHYIRRELVGRLEPVLPTILVYDVDPESGETRDLVALEWVKWDDDQDVSTDDDRPTMFGVPFDGPFERVEDMPVRYDLHAWVWKENPSGVFARWNPTVRC